MLIRGFRLPLVSGVFLPSLRKYIYIISVAVTVVVVTLVCAFPALVIRGMFWLSRSDCVAQQNSKSLLEPRLELRTLPVGVS